jgi:hypothetical protein
MKSSAGLGFIIRSHIMSTPPPWDTPQGRACFDRWIAYAMAKLNAYKGGEQFNARKPWSINQYGILAGNPRFGPSSVHAPDGFERYNYNRYWWIWDHYNPTPYWEVPEWDGAGIEGVQSYVTKCLSGG